MTSRTYEWSTLTSKVTPMRLRFTIRDLLLLTVIVALAAGWWADRRAMLIRHIDLLTKARAGARPVERNQRHSTSVVKKALRGRCGEGEVLALRTAT